MFATEKPHINSLPVILSGSPLVSNPFGYGSIITATFGLVFVALFNWTQVTEWNQFKESIEENKLLMDKHGF